MASDLINGSIVEAAVDDFVLTSFPLIADSAAPVVGLTNPTGGEVMAPNDNFDITWTQSDDIGVVHVEILLSTDSGANYDYTIASGALNGSFSWTVPEMNGDFNRVKVICYDTAGNSTEDASAADFKIGTTSGVGDLPVGRLALAQNSPNPFNPAHGDQLLPAFAAERDPAHLQRGRPPGPHPAAGCPGRRSQDRGVERKGRLRKSSGFRLVFLPLGHR